MRSLLITGFEPFARYRQNSSWEAIRDLDGTTVGGWKLAARRLPVGFRAGPKLKRELARLAPRAAIAFGLAPEKRVRPERVALNFVQSHRERRPRSIRPGGPLAFETKLPLDRILAGLKRRRIPARESYHAGTYFCNYVFYLLRADSPRLVSGFVHLPPLGKGGWPLARLRRAAREVVRIVASSL